MEPVLPDAPAALGEKSGLGTPHYRERVTWSCMGGKMGQVETVQKIYEAFGKGDVPAILDQLADDVEWDRDAPSYGVPIYEPGTGKDHVRRFFETTQVSGVRT